MRNAFLAALLLGVSGLALGELTAGTPAPEFSRRAVWIGTGGRALSMKELRGKVVLVDFWDYTCINCIRTFPHLKEWYARYHKDGLEIIGVQTGEFEFASVAKNVERAYQRFQLPYPAVADVKDQIWHAYDCNFWPDTFFIDRSGVIREVHHDEGDYGKQERFIQELLKQGHPDLDYSSVAIPEDKQLFGKQCGAMSPEIMVGAKLGGLFGGQIANAEGFLPGSIVAYKPTEKRVIRGFFAEGAWKNQPDDFESAEDPTSTHRASLGISYRGRDVYAVLDRGSKEPVDVIVTRNGVPIPQGQRGKDIHVRADGQTAVLIDEPRMYYLVTNEDDTQTHELILVPTGKGARICSFTFGNRCLEIFDRL